MISAKICKEISVQVLNDVGILAELTRIVADKGIDVQAAAAWVENESRGTIRLVTDDNLRATEALKHHKFIPREIDSVKVLTQHTPGMLSTICTRLAEGGVSIQYLYASAPVSDEECLVVVSTDNNERALAILNE